MSSPEEEPHSHRIDLTESVSDRPVVSVGGDILLVPPMTDQKALENPVPFEWKLFKQFIQRLFSHWHVLTGIHEHNIVSPEKFEKCGSMFVEEMLEFFQQFADDPQPPRASEIAGFISQVVEEDFGTLIEDDSDVAVATAILECFHRMRAGDISLLTQMRSVKGLRPLPGMGGKKKGKKKVPKKKTPVKPAEVEQPVEQPVEEPESPEEEAIEEPVEEAGHESEDKE
eukprot:gnl/Dysnectes_brevis/704_a777_4576.p1 GENE.gnl/Dysnectes_brevis/704_a777_4576~~gnl/Dysnectes_brevis/704_a777_4576.p1  ORF type:complete len:245 (+),score=43.04 gnl/Dysnectes_brevis/704_a777_4576:56-736(+)